MGSKARPGPGIIKPRPFLLAAVATVVRAVSGRNLLLCRVIKDYEKQLTQLVPPKVSV